MLRKYGIIVASLLLLLLAACGSSEKEKREEELNTLLEVLSEDESGEALIELLDTVYENEPYEEQLAKAEEEANSTISELKDMNLTTSPVSDLRDSFIVTIEDLQEVLEVIETNDGNLDDEQWTEIEEISTRVNERQMDAIQEKVKEITEE